MPSTASAGVDMTAVMGRTSRSKTADSASDTTANSVTVLPVAFSASGFLGRAVLLHKGQIVGDAQLSDLEEQGQTLMDYVKSSYHYQSDRVSRALSDLTGKEDTDA